MPPGGCYVYFFIIPLRSGLDATFLGSSRILDFFLVTSICAFLLLSCARYGDQDRLCPFSRPSYRDDLRIRLRPVLSAAHLKATPLIYRSISSLVLTTYWSPHGIGIQAHSVIHHLLIQPSRYLIPIRFQSNTSNRHEDHGEAGQG